MKPICKCEISPTLHTEFQSLGPPPTLWDKSKPLTYGIINPPNVIPLEDIKVAINEAIRNWGVRIPLKMEYINTTDPSKVDCPIQWSKTDPTFLNADGTPNFATLAYSYVGDDESLGFRGLMLNGNVNFNVRAINFAYLYQNTVTHEFGHTLGLEHSTNQTDIMYAFYNGMETLGAGDISAIQALYGKRNLSQRIIDILNALTLSGKEL